MDFNELNMLEVIHRHEYISQREISSEVGISLGMVNLLLKKFLKVGIIKAEKLTGNKVKYILTPEGIVFLSKKTIDFVSRSYQAVKKIQVHITEVIKRHYTIDEMVFIFGIEDEIGSILLDVLHKNGYAYKWVESEENLSKFVQWHDIEGNGIFLLK